MLKIIICILFIVCLIIVLFKYFTKRESFDASRDISRQQIIQENISRVNGYEDGNYSEYRSLWSQFPLGIWRKHDYDSLKMETKLPSLVCQKWYNNKCHYPVPNPVPVSDEPTGLELERPDNSKLSVENLLEPKW